MKKVKIRLQSEIIHIRTTYHVCIHATGCTGTL